VERRAHIYLQVRTHCTRVCTYPIIVLWELSANPHDGNHGIVHSGAQPVLGVRPYVLGFDSASRLYVVCPCKLPITCAATRMLTS
jgi:hypothetical protein